MEYPFRKAPWDGAAQEKAENIWESFRAKREAILSSPYTSVQVDGGPATFSTRGDLAGFIGSYAVPVGRELAGLAGITSEWQLKMVDELSKGVFYARRVVYFQDEVVKRIAFIPLDEMEVETRREPTVESIRSSMQRRMWKESVRAKDYLAAGMPIVRDLPRRYRIAVKKMVLENLEYLRLAEKSGWSLPGDEHELSAYHRAQIAIQSRFGRATFKY